MTREALILACHDFNPAFRQPADSASRSFAEWIVLLLDLQMILLVFLKMYPRWSPTEREAFWAVLHERGVSREQVPQAVSGLFAGVVAGFPRACQAVRELYQLTLAWPNVGVHAPVYEFQRFYNSLVRTKWEMVSIGGSQRRWLRQMAHAAIFVTQRLSPELGVLLRLAEESDAARRELETALTAGLRELFRLRIEPGKRPGEHSWCGQFRRVRPETAQAFRVLELRLRGLSPTEIATLLYPDVPLRIGRVSVRKALQRIYPVVFNVLPPDGRRVDYAESGAEAMEDREGEEEDEFLCPVCWRPVTADNRGSHETCAVLVHEKRAADAAARAISASAAVRRGEFLAERG